MKTKVKLLAWLAMAVVVLTLSGCGTVGSIGTALTSRSDNRTMQDHAHNGNNVYLGANY